MGEVITTICLTAYALGFTNAEEVCKYADTVVEMSEEYRVQPELIVALVYHESRWNPRAKSKVACGLTQVIPKWTKNPRLTCKQLCDDPKLSLRTGIKKLSALLYSKRYAGGNINIALCAYNAGFSNCKSNRIKWNGTSYSRQILKTSKKFREKMLTFDPEAEDEVF